MKILCFIFLFLLFHQGSAQVEITKVTKTASTSMQVIAPIHDLTIFPKMDSFVKHAIFLETIPSEKMYKLEIYAVKNSEVDQCNQHHLLGDFEIKNLPGWGYVYYIFKSQGNLISSKLGCGDDVKIKKFVPSGKSETLNYMSMLPLVVYAPEGILIKYKIWRQDPKEHSATMIE